MQTSSILKQLVIPSVGLLIRLFKRALYQKNYDWIFDNTMEKKMVTIKLHDYGDYMGEQFIANPEGAFDEELFNETEMKAMEAVASYFEKATVNIIVNKSHEENAWAENVEEFKSINYNYGFDLKYPEVNN